MEYLNASYTLCIVALGTCLLGITTGVLGVFTVLRRNSLLGDAIAHAALPGIALAFLFTKSKNPALLLCGGAISGALGTLLVRVITQKTNLKQDAALGIVLSVFFGFGLVLLTVIQKLPVANQAILNKFLFGNASTLLPADLYTLIALSCVVLCCIILVWKELCLITFDPHFAHLAYQRTTIFDLLLTTLLIITIVIGLQTVGVIFISTLLIAPATAARLWCTRLPTTAILSAIFSSCSCLTGSILSSTIKHLPTGPTIVVIMSGLVFFSLVLPQRILKRTP